MKKEETIKKKEERSRRRKKQKERKKKPKTKKNDEEEKIKITVIMRNTKLITIMRKTKKITMKKKEREKKNTVQEAKSPSGASTMGPKVKMAAEIQSRLMRARRSLLVSAARST